MSPQQCLDQGSLRTPVLGSSSPICDDDGTSIRTAISAVEMRLSDPTDLSHISDSKRYVREHRKLLSSLTRRVPPEILIHIFIQCLDPARLSPPWYLSHICHYWRELALRTPQLWTRIPLPSLLNRSRLAEALVAFMPEYIGRSKDQAITFRWEGNWDPRLLDEDDEFEDPLCGHADAILDLLIQHAERWGSVTIVSGRWTLRLEQQLVQLHNRLPRLYHLGLDIEGFQVTPTGVFRMTPQLRDIDLYVAADQGSSHSLPDFIHWKELKRLKLELPISTSLSYLSLCHKLVVLDLEFFGPGSMTSGPDKINLPNLKHLRFSTTQNVYAEHFDFITSPVLEDFRTSCRITELEPFSSFVRFLERNAKTLKCLTFAYPHPIPNVLRLNLTLLPLHRLVHLEYLKLHYRYIDLVPGFLHSIGQGMIPLRRLHTLHILLDDHYHLSYTRIKVLSADLNALVCWAEAPNSGSCLRHIEIISGQGYDVLDFFTVLQGWNIEERDEKGIYLIEEELCEVKLQRIYYPFPLFNTDAVIVDIFNESKTQEILDCLDTLERKIVDDVKLLYRTRVHFMLYAFGKMSADQFAPVGEQIPERALALIDKWKRLFEEDIPHRRWMHQGLEKVVYVPIDDEFYRPNVEYWMYGLKPYFGNGTVEDVFY